MYFPRLENGKDLFSVEEKEVRFNCEMDSQTWMNLPFKLEKMVYQGNLEI